MDEKRPIYGEILDKKRGEDYKGVFVQYMYYVINN